ncbi:hypothetical protein BDV98DRAFT_95444 [Pterulicium gracile]|uniref:F-box domain-containing protein n=1 Tax=Pterulicium gracile TaxID=1884261 RepID=A0A5C3QR09_9AGAR|nr:hypothetical protein BDV98DRAFT_95444 [Pterula gracilis]
MLRIFSPVLFRSFPDASKRLWKEQTEENNAQWLSFVYLCLLCLSLAHLILNPIDSPLFLFSPPCLLVMNPPFLSPETLSRIFASASSGPDCDSSLPTSSPWSFSQTWRSWRAVCHSNPCLWCIVSVRCQATWNDMHPRRFGFLRRRLVRRVELAKDRPLKILIGMGLRGGEGVPIDPGVEELSMSLLWEHRESWRSLYLAVGVNSSLSTWASRAFRQGKLGGLHRLETLEIAFSKQAMEAHIILSLFKNAPALSQVRLHKPPDPQEHPWQTIRTHVTSGDESGWLSLRTFCLLNHSPSILPNILLNVNHVTLLHLDCVSTKRNHISTPRLGSQTLGVKGVLAYQ